MEKQNNELVKEPTFKLTEIHPETEVKSDDINIIFKSISNDIDSIKNSIISNTSSFKDLMDLTVLKLKDIEKILNTEKERGEDLSILCNKQTDYSNIVLLSNNYETNLDSNNGIFNLKKKRNIAISAKIDSVIGNGYPGNKYVYNYGEFIDESINTINPNNMLDGSMYTSFEYSRINASNDEKIVFPLVNKDSIYARCTIQISSEEEFNNLKISSVYNDLVLNSIETSIDGITFVEQKMRDVQICNKEKRFDKEDYVYGSGIIAFNNSKYVRLSFSASNYTDDTIAFNTKDDNGVDSVIVLNSGKRSVIRINDIGIFKTEYENSGELIMNNIVKEDIDTISIFANEYCSDEIDIRKSITYTLNVNGTNYDIIPINSLCNGKKIIRTTNQTIPANYVIYINETIKNATLTINMNTSEKNQTPYVSDFKILIGKDDDDV